MGCFVDKRVYSVLVALFSCLSIRAQAMAYKAGKFKIKHEDGARCLKGMWALYVQFFLSLAG